jgi:hypothetical protein
MKTNWNRTTLARIDSGTLDEAIIRFMRKRLKALFNAGSNHAAWDVVHAVEKHHPSVSESQRAKGIAWLRSIAFKKDGSRRNTKHAQQFGARDLGVLRDQGRRLSARLVGFHLDCRSGYTHGVWPIYRIDDGKHSFDYVATSWQSGGAFWIEARDGERLP